MGSGWEKRAENGPEQTEAAKNGIFDFAPGEIGRASGLAGWFDSVTILVLPCTHYSLSLGKTLMSNCSGSI